MDSCQQNRISDLLSKGLLAVALAPMLLSGCALGPHSSMIKTEAIAPPSSTTEINRALASAALRTPGDTTDYRLGAEDLLEITLFNVPSALEATMGVTPRLTEVRVSQEGMIPLPLLGDIPVAGMSTSSLEQSLRQRYDEYFYSPQVRVQVKEFRSQRISVMGAVRNPGVLQLTGPKTLVDLLSMAGGIDQEAGSQVHVYRQGSEGRRTQVVDLLALASTPELINMPVQAGDVINVPQAGMFFVDGAVGRPGSYPLNRPYTLSQALAIAGGVTEVLADYSSVAIFRTQEALESDRILVNLKDVLAGESVDPRIKADDVIIVPMSIVKYVIERFLGQIGLPGVPGMPR
jgi:polysaccharide export outer membrane protein